MPPILDGEDNTKEDHACMMYQVIDPTEGCVADNFNQSNPIACSKHIFSPDVPYAYSLVEEMDLPSCTQAGNWPLKVIIWHNACAHCAKFLSKETFGLYLFTVPHESF